MKDGPKLKILFFADNYFPEITAASFRSTEHAEAWARAGHSVQVITCFPNFPLGKVFPGYRGEFYRSEEIEKVKIKRMWTLTFANRGFFLRVADFLSYSFHAMLVGVFYAPRADRIVSTSPQFFTSIPACVLAWIFQKPWVLEIRDLWPDSVVTVGAAKAGWYLKPFFYLEKLFYRRATAIIAVTNGIRRRISEKGIALDKIVVIPNGAMAAGSRTADSAPDERPPEVKQIQDRAGKRRVVSYFGTFGMAQKLGSLLPAIKKLSKDYFFVFIGEGAEGDLLRELAADLENCLILNARRKEELRHFYQITDWGLIHLSCSDLFDDVLPSKIFDYASHDVPILLGVGGESKQLIEEYGAGISFAPENPESLVKTLDQWAKLGGAQMERFKTGLKKICADFDRTKLAEQALSVIESSRRA